MLNKAGQNKCDECNAYFVDEGELCENCQAKADLAEGTKPSKKSNKKNED